MYVLLVWLQFLKSWGGYVEAYELEKYHQALKFSWVQKSIEVIHNSHLQLRAKIKYSVCYVALNKMVSVASTDDRHLTVNCDLWFINMIKRV